MSDIGNHVKETLRTANQAFEAGAKAAGDDNTRKLRRLIERSERVNDLLMGRKGGALIEQSMIEAAIIELKDAIAEARRS